MVAEALVLACIIVLDAHRRTRKDGFVLICQIRFKSDMKIGPYRYKVSHNLNRTEH